MDIIGERTLSCCSFLQCFFLHCELAEFQSNSITNQSYYENPKTRCSHITIIYLVLYSSFEFVILFLITAKSKTRIIRCVCKFEFSEQTILIMNIEQNNITFYGLC